MKLYFYKYYEPIIITTARNFCVRISFAQTVCRKQHRDLYRLDS